MQGVQQKTGEGVILSGQNLVLQKVTRTKAGKYWCSATNSLKTTVSEPVTLKLNCKYQNMKYKAVIYDQ